MEKLSAIREMIYRIRNHEDSGTVSAETLAQLAEKELIDLENTATNKRLEIKDVDNISDEELEIFANNNNWRNHPSASLARMVLSARKELADLRADALVSQQFQSDVLMPLFDKLEQAGYSGTWSQKVDAVCELAGLKQANLAYKNGIHQGRIDAFMLVEGALYKNRHKDNVNKMLDMVEVMLREENKRSILPLESEGTK